MPPWNLKTEYKYIAINPAIRSGRPIVAGTRVAVHDVIGLLQNGETPDSLRHCLPEITKAQIYECLAYYEDHRDEIDREVTLQMAEGGQ